MVGEGHRRHAQFLGPLDQLLDPARAVEQRVLAVHVEMDEFGGHGWPDCWRGEPGRTGRPRARSHPAGLWKRLRRSSPSGLAQHAELDRVDQGFPARLDDVLADADAASSLPRRSRPAGRGDGAGTFGLVEDAHLVVDQLDVGEVRVLAHDRLAQRRVHGVDGAVALGGADDALAATWTLMVASTTALPSSRFSTITRKLSRRNSGSCGASSWREQEVERGVGGLVVVALVLARP